MITIDQLTHVCLHTSPAKLERLHPYICEAMEEFEIDTRLRISAFIAQLAHESGGFMYFEEIASGRAYDGRADLGNTKPEAIRIAREHGSTPGPWWKGHGPIQITGYDNHLYCGQDLDLDLLHQPRLICTPEHGFRSAGWFWETRGLNRLADIEDFLKISIRINGRNKNTGLPNGWEDREEHYERARRYLV